MELYHKEIGEGKPVIILHGLFGSSDNWVSIAKGLSGHHKVYLVDQRNHGRSFHSGEFTYEAMAKDLLNFIEKHNIERPIIIGHSMGGKVAMYFGINHPDKYEKLVVVDISPRAYPLHHQAILEGMTSIDPGKVTSRRQADEQLASYVEEKGVRQFLLKNLSRDEDGKFSWNLNLPVINEKIGNMGKGLEGKYISDKPTLFIRGENSDYISNKDGIVIESLFPNFEMKTVAGAGHWVHAEKPVEFLEIVEDFIHE